MSEDTPARATPSNPSSVLRRLAAVTAIVLAWLGVLTPAVAYDKWIPTPWLEAVGRLTPSRCGGGVDPQAVKYPSLGDGSYNFPERKRDAIVGLGNSACIGAGNGVGRCQELVGWADIGACAIGGGGSTAGTAFCPYAVTLITKEIDGDGCGKVIDVGQLKDYGLQTGKHCQAIDSNGRFDTASRNCYCATGVFVPEQQRCIDTADVVWMPDCDTCVGNPIYPATGAKVQRFLLGWQPWYGLRATFNSNRRIPYDATLGPSLAPADPSTLGQAWTSNLDKLVRRSENSSRPSRLSFSRGDGLSTVARWTGSGYRPVLDGALEAIVERAGMDGWTYRSPKDGLFEVYDATGTLIEMADMTGKRLAILRSDAGTPAAVAPRPGLPIELTDQDGRVVKLRYAMPDPDGAPVLTEVVDPAGASTSLRYGAGSPRPVEIVHADSTSTQLLYEDANSTWALTGYLDESGIRAGTYAYDAEGRAVSTARAGGLDAYTVSWAQPSRWSWSESYDQATGKVLRVHALQPASGIVVTYPNGQTDALTASSFMGAVQWSSKTQQAGAGSPMSTTSRQFDDRGNVTQLDDYNGNRSCMSYDAARNLETERVEGLTAATACASIGSGTWPVGARKVSRQWHPAWRLAIKTAEPGRLTTLVYNGQPDPFDGNAIAQCEATGKRTPDGGPLAVLCKRVEQATTDATGASGFGAVAQSGVSARIWRWTYNATGQVLTEVDPRGTTTTTNVYYATTTADYTTGDLFTSTNAAGHVTRFPRYNAYGQPLEMVDANGIGTVYTYDARQRLKTVASSGDLTTYEYWPTGLLKRTLQSDGTALSYEYDAARRLTAVVDTRGNRIEYTLDQSGNRTQEVVKDPTGTLKRTMSRAFDALGRAQQTTGRE
ncbi:hypothetical protein CDN99_26530 [Roseateles aquatilis]|uniref:RHS repeat protein n=2 Tax=Roseateles aquatilis TaxID=431061 RepID=A0A246IT56_9BURK|nr:hypothetical protein CDN99_26530 [Roseateles aquatilis]